MTRIAANSRESLRVARKALTQQGLPLGKPLLASRAAVQPKISARCVWGPLANRNDSRSFALIRGIRANKSRPTYPTDHRRTFEISRKQWRRNPFLRGLLERIRELDQLGLTARRTGEAHVVR